MPVIQHSHILRLVWLIPGLALTIPVLAQQVGPPPLEDIIPETEEQAIESVQMPFTPASTDDAPENRIEEEVAGIDKCDWAFEDRPIQEGTQDALYGMTCHTFRWFDGLFGKNLDFPEERVNGLLTFGGAWTQYDGLDPRFRLKVRAPLPNWNNRWDLVLGRVDDDAFISDTQGQDRTFYNPGLVNRGDSESWVLGLGHRTRGGRKGWDWSVGLKVRSNPVPYAKTQWYYYKAFNERSDLRFRQTFFWRSDDGWGATSRGDYAWGISTTDVMRWEGVITSSQATEGAEWFVGQTWYHLFGDRSAFSLLAFVNGETDHSVDLKEYGFNFIWRRPFTRDWIYLSLGPSITWPRYLAEEQRELSLGFSTWIEMEFGSWSYR
jgi:hypothetical protein